MEHLIESKEAAEILGISQTAVHRLVNRGTLPAIWLGSRRIFVRHQVLKLLEDPEYRKRSRADREGAA
jgi:excisionase family DNA binding protein